MAEAEPLISAIKYIDLREKTLSRYSDKLRRSVERIFNVFGDSEECQICDCTEDDYVHYKYYYYDSDKEYHTCYSIKTGTDVVPNEIHGMKVEVLEKDEALDAETIDIEAKSFDKDRKVWFVFKNPHYHKFMPKVFVSIDIEDGVPFYTEEEEYRINEYYLAFHKHKLVIVMKSRGKSEVWSAEKLVYGPHEVSRECLKALVKSGRLLQFLNSVAGKLETMDEEYKEVSEIAEKMAKAIEG